MNSDALFTMMRFQILAGALTPGVRERLSDPYVYAWDDLVYPIQHEGAAWHQPFSHLFSVSRGMMEELTRYLDDRWLERRVPTFYQMEQHYSVRDGTGPWDRSKQLHACRYMHLCNLFDEDFWSNLLTAGQHPAEARIIVHAYNRSEDLYFH